MSYQSAGGALKLKGTGGMSIKKKKKKKEAKKILEQISMTSTHSDGDSTKGKKDSRKKDNRTEAQKAFAKVQEKRQEARILEKASKKHKDRVEEFNSKLDTLTEHFDIPKVSWTK